MKTKTALRYCLILVKDVCNLKNKNQLDMIPTVFPTLGRMRGGQ